MFVFRVALGDVYVNDQGLTSKTFTRPPCKVSGCKKINKCIDHGELFDSVLGDTRHAGDPLLFREFVIYEQDRCYPEFLVEYTREA